MDECESQSEAETIKYTEDGTQEALLIHVEEIPVKLRNTVETEEHVDELEHKCCGEFHELEQDKQRKILFDHEKPLDSNCCLVGQLKCDIKRKRFVNVAKSDGQSKSRLKTKSKIDDELKLNDDDVVKRSDSNLPKSRYKCLECDKGFHYKSLMLGHAHTHSYNETLTKKTPSRFPCPECNKGFHYAAHLRKHSRVHTGETPFVCSICQKGFKHSSHLKRHSLYHMESNGVPAEKSQCDMCGNYYTNISQHMKSHLGIIFRKDRIAFKEDSSGQTEGQCTVCSKSFSRPRQLKRHMRIHTGDFSHQCEQCQKYFHERADLVIHQRVHAGVYPYPCTECDHRFRFSGNFHRHMRVWHNRDLNLGE